MKGLYANIAAKRDRIEKQKEARYLADQKRQGLLD